jgi:hypothetical protein
MNKIVASVGLAALGASSIQAVHAQAAPPPKAWNVSASLRGFYDDNINSSPQKETAWGYEVSPGVGLNLRSDQTTFVAGYIYTFKYYDHTPAGSTLRYDQIHQFNADLDHRFSERYSVAVKDSFVIGQEPDLLRANNAFTSFQRVPGSNIRNYGAIDFNAQFTPVFGMQAGYANSYYNYKDSGFNGTTASSSGSSDRIEQTFHLDGRWQLAPDTVGIIGYQYGMFNYTGDEQIGTLQPGNIVLMSDSRNDRSQYGYLGLDHKFLSNFSGTLRAGARYTDYYNDPNGNNTQVSPYVLANLHYDYAPESFVEAGFSFDRNATDQLSISGNSFTLDQESAVLYGSLTHRILPHLFGNVTGQYQASMYNGGADDGQVDNFFLLGLNLRYQFNPYLSAEVGYNYDKLNSEVPNRGFSRNQVYIGLTGRY